MSTLTDELVDLITESVGRCNVDVLSGWEAGASGKRRVGGRLFDRSPPAHLVGQRLRDWYAGRDGGIAHRANARRQTVFLATGTSGDEMKVVRKGWVARGPVITQLEKAGAMGDVDVYYLDSTGIKRTHRCGI